MECGVIEYPIYYDNAVIGKICIIKDGLYQRLEASCAMREGVLRLWLRGEDKTSYIGILMPQNGKLVLQKAYSRTEAAALPKNVMRAVAAERAPELQISTEKEKTSDGAWRAGKGCLYKNEGSSMLVALPTELEQSTRGTRIELINGRRYMLFRY